MNGYRIEEGSYRGFPTIAIYDEGNGERPVLRFGLRKARAIVASIETIAAFVLAHDEGEGESDGDQSDNTTGD